jgi:murein DD-endopeptidase MepM/ murein hydrolase activator NlpD
MANREYYESLLKNPNVIAMLNTIAEAEGCDDNYGCSFGGSTLPLNSKSHPFPGSDCSFDVNGPRAVGRYQYCGNTWDDLNRAAGGGLDFSNPRDQDLAAVIRMEQRGVLNRVIEGDVVGALSGDGANKSGALPAGLAWEWASLPPYRYKGQGTKTTQEVVATFQKFNGKPLPGSSKVSNGSPSSLSSNADLVAGNSSFSATRSDCPKFDYTFSFAKITTGCNMKAVAGFGAGTSLTSGGTLTKPGASGQATLLKVPVNLPNGLLAWPLRDDASNGVGVLFSLRGTYRSVRRPNHNGVDLASVSPDGVSGANIVSPLDGKVILVSYQAGGAGNFIEVEHPNKIWTRYMHFFKVLVAEGQEVKAGTVLGIEGTTGGSTGVHLHFEVRVGSNENSSNINPAGVLQFEDSKEQLSYEKNEETAEYRAEIGRP